MTIDSADDSKISNRTINTNRISNRTYDSKSNRITKLRRSLGQTDGQGATLNVAFYRDTDSVKSGLKAREDSTIHGFCVAERTIQTEENSRYCMTSQ